MKQKSLALLVVALVFSGLSLNSVALAKPGGDVTGAAGSTVNHAALAESKYDRLMRTFISKFKLAFSEEDDAKTLAALSQFSEQFTLDSEEVVKALSASVTTLSPAETKALTQRLEKKNRAEELIALLFNERITSRLEKNQELRQAVDQLVEKNLEFQQQDYQTIR